MSLYFKWKLLWFLLEDSMFELFVKPNKKRLFESTHCKEQWKFNSSMFFSFLFTQAPIVSFMWKTATMKGKDIYPNTTKIIVVITVSTLHWINWSACLQSVLIDCDFLQCPVKWFFHQRRYFLYWKAFLSQFGFSFTPCYFQRLC